MLHLRLNVQSILQWDRDERLAYTKAARLEFLQSRFNLSLEEATAIVRFSGRVMKERPDLYKIAEYMDTRQGEREIGASAQQEVARRRL